MAEIVGIVGTVIAIIQITDRVIRYGFDYAEASKEVLELKNSLENLKSLAGTLRERCENAEPNARWLHGLLEVRGQQLDEKGVLVPEYGGMLVELRNVIEDMAVTINPSKNWKKSEAYRKFKWHFQKPKIIEMQAKVTRCGVLINTVLALKNDETATELLDVTKENNKLTQSHLTSLDTRFSVFEENQKLEKEERKRRDAEIEREEIVNWLSPLTFIAKQEELYTLSFKETGGLLWDDKRFKTWAKGRPWYLQCIGAPGIGKTVLSSILTHNLPTKSKQRPLILSIFLDYKSSSAQTLPYLIGSLLKQMIQLDENYAIPEALRKLCQKAKRLGLTPQSYAADVRNILVAELDRYDRIYLVVDAFDELGPRERITLKRELLKLRPEKLSLVITMRPIAGETYAADKGLMCDRCKEILETKMRFRCKICDKGNYDICLDCVDKGRHCLDDKHQLIEPYEEIQITLEVPDKDIEQYVRWVIGVELGDKKPLVRDERIAGADIPDTTPFQDLCQSDPDLLDQIITTVTEKANGRFLFARLYLDTLKSQSNRRMMKKALRTFPDNINDIHKDAITRIEGKEATQKTLAYRVLGLAAHARRSLSLEALRHALAAMTFDDDEDDATEDEILDATDPVKAILDATSGLVVIESNGMEVKLVHRSLEDYIQREESNKEWFLKANSDIARACLTYLRLVIPPKQQVEEYYAAKNAKYPFLKYASQYWGDHVRDSQAAPEPARSIQAAALRLIKDTRRLDSCIQAAYFTNTGGPDTWDTRSRVDRLHVCAWYGLSFAISTLDPDNDDIDVIERKYGQTPLMYACRKGHIDVARQLIDRGASVNRISAKGRTALFEAIAGQHDEVVDVFHEMNLRELDVNAVQTKEFNQTALMLAIREHRPAMVKTLLQMRGMDIDRQDTFGRTALYHAAKEGIIELVDLVLEAGPNVDLVDNQVGRSPLRIAAERNHSEVVERLLEAKYCADPNLKDRLGGTALLRAVNQGAQETVETLRKYAVVDSECVDETGQSLLHGASKNNEIDTVRRLTSGPNSLDPNTQDKAGRTPLHLACQYGHLAVASALLEDNGSSKVANPLLKDKFDRTPRTVAWQYGNGNIVTMLAKREEAQINRVPESVPDEKELPIWAMATQGLADIIQEAIKTRPSDVTVTEPFSDRTALHCAIIANHFDIVINLLDSGKIDINKRDDANVQQRTPLMVASIDGHLSAINVLIAHKADLDIKDRWGEEALVLAQSSGHLEVMIALIEAGAAIDSDKINMDHIFFAAVEAGSIKAVEKLLAKGVDRSKQNSNGLRALNIATANDDVDMMRMLKAAPTVQFMNDKSGTTGLPAGNQRFVPFRSRPILPT